MMAKGMKFKLNTDNVTHAIEPSAITGIDNYILNKVKGNSTLDTSDDQIILKINGSDAGTKITVPFATNSTNATNAANATNAGTANKVANSLSFTNGGNTSKAFDGSTATKIQLVGTSNRISVTQDGSDAGKFTFDIGGNVITNTSYGSTDGYGIVKLSDTFSSSADALSTSTDVWPNYIAATPKHVKAAYDEAITTIKNHYGNITGAFVYQGTVTGESGLTNTAKGSVYIASGNFTLTVAKSASGAVEYIEPSDMLISNGEKWAVVQRNIVGAVTVGNTNGTLDTLTSG
jgi:hypothetical protein